MNVIWYEMNSPQSSIDPYFDCGLGSSPTPTVVKNFKLPNSNINKDGPFLQISQPPQTKFRFRYKSEMVGTHGQLKAETSDKNKTIYPTVKLCNWNRGPALVRLMLYTAEENDNERKRHVHELSGKNCNKEGFTGGCEVVVDEKNNYTAEFPSLGIIHIAKRDVKNIIFQRKKEQLVNYACMRNPALRNEGIQHNISPTDLQKLKEEAEEEAKAMDLNKVVLRFQAFFFNTKANCYKPITEYVDSDIIFNLKNASTGELKIVRISAVSAPSTGGTEVWMLVEKVKKNNVRVKFFELDADGCEIWKGYGEFKESDVHHQYAIVFKTPAYCTNNIHEPVQVKIQLERPNDNDTSDAIDFTYTAPNLKRPNAYLENKVDSDLHPLKRVRTSVGEPIDLKTGHLFLGHGDGKQQPFSPETVQQSPPHMVPSPIAPADSPSSQLGFYSPHHSGELGGGGIIFSATHEDSLALNFDHIQVLNSLDTITNTNNYHIIGGDSQLNGFLTTEGGLLSASYQSSAYSVPQPSTSPLMASPSYHQVPSPAQSQHSPYNHQLVYNDSPTPVVPLQTSETAFDQIQQFDAYQKAQKPRFDFSDLVSTPNQNNQNVDMDLLDIISDSKMFSAPREFGDIQADSATKDKSPKKPAPTERTSSVGNNDMDTLADHLASISVSKNVNKASASHQKPSPEKLDKDIAFRVALKAAECLQVYAAYGDTNLLLAAHRYLLGVQNNQGDNSLHTAVNNKNLEAFNKIINAAMEVYYLDLLNAQNYSGETPLHLAAKQQQLIMIQRLLESPVCNLNVIDCEGNTPIHVAAGQSSHLCLSLLLNGPSNGSEKELAKVINAHNYHGKTPIHLAVESGCWKKVELLLQAGAPIHTCERKRGANALHLAVIGQHVAIAKHIIKKTTITVDARMFDGNTALHIAAQAGNKELCMVLMSAKANPQAKNSIRKNHKRPESEEEDEDEEEEEEDDDKIGSEEEEDFFTPFDYAAEKSEILEILGGQATADESALHEPALELRTNGNHNKDSKVAISTNAIDSGIDISSTDLQEK